MQANGVSIVFYLELNRCALLMLVEAISDQGTRILKYKI